MQGLLLTGGPFSFRRVVPLHALSPRFIRRTVIANAGKAVGICCAAGKIHDPKPPSLVQRKERIGYGPPNNI